MSVMDQGNKDSIRANARKLGEFLGGLFVKKLDLHALKYKTCKK